MTKVQLAETDAWRHSRNRTGVAFALAAKKAGRMLM